MNKIDINDIIQIIMTCSLTFTFGLLGIAQVPIDFKPDGKTKITNAVIHVGNGTLFNKGTLVFNKGKIVYCGTDSLIHRDSENNINAKGAHIYPGFIALNTSVGLEEISMVKATIDVQEIGSFNPNVRCLTSFNTDSRIIPTLRSNGVLFAQSTPRGGIISGQSSVFKMDGWNWQDAVIRADDGIWLNWPVRHRSNGWWAEPEKSNPNDRYKKEIDEIIEYFKIAKVYYASILEEGQAPHLGFEAMKGLWNKSKKLFIRVNEAKAMIHCVEEFENLGIRPILVGAYESWKIIDFLKSKDIQIVLENTNALPESTDDDIWQNYKNPQILADAGIHFCISQQGFWEIRNLAFQAGHAISKGLDSELAIQALTLNAANILGLADQLGSLEIGKNASFFMSTGDALDMKSQNIFLAFIHGELVDLDDHQKQLYRKFEKKYSKK